MSRTSDQVNDEQIGYIQHITSSSLVIDQLFHILPHSKKLLTLQLAAITNGWCHEEHTSGVENLAQRLAISVQGINFRYPAVPVIKDRNGP